MQHHGSHHALWMLVLFCVAWGNVDWLEPNICNSGSGWEKIPDPYMFHHPHKPFDDKWTSPEAKIVVLIAALRETRLPQTIIDMYSKAKYQDRIIFAVVQQNAEGDADAQLAVCKQLGTPAIVDGDTFKPGDCKIFHQIRMMRMDATEAKGPCYARGLGAELVEEGDEFCMQIDAHTDVIENWDEAILKAWADTDNEYAVLSTYPTNVKDLNENSNKHWEMPILCKGHFIGRGLIRNAQASACANLEKPALSAIWAAGLSFSRCHAERNVPNDKLLQGVFMGEEYARGARLWTHGYDFYSLARPIIGTYYGGEKHNSGTFSTTAEQRNIATRRLTTLLKWPDSDQSQKAHDELGRMDLGHRRTLEQYAIFSGVDTINQKTSEIPTCTNLTYVPWNNNDDVYMEFKGGSEGSAGSGGGAGHEAHKGKHWNHAQQLVMEQAFLEHAHHMRTDDTMAEYAFLTLFFLCCCVGVRIVTMDVTEGKKSQD